MRPVSIATLLSLLGGLLALATAAPAPPVGDTGTIKGRVVSAGPDIPERKELTVNKDKAECLARGPILDETWVIDPDTKGLRNVFVWLAPADAGTKLPVTPAAARETPEPAEMDNVACVYVPHALALREGQPLVLKNSATINHCPSWRGSPAKNPGGNIIIPPGREYTIENLKADTTPIAFACHIRTWMKAWVRVFDHPYYAVTDAAGRFEIPHAPVGTFRIVYWHDTGYRGGAAGKTGEPITIRPGTNDLGQVEWKP